VQVAGQDGGGWVTPPETAGTAAFEQDLRALRTLLGNLPGMAYRCHIDRQWIAEFLSDACRALTGYAPADLVHNARLSYADLIHPADREVV
jgi:hypothetical protein